MSGCKARPLAERFMDKVLKTENCWLWLGHTDDRGYGKINVGSRTDKSKTDARAARVSYELFVGPIPDGVFILHSCDNESCVRPDHLRPGTHLDNMADMRARGRAICGRRGGEHPSAKLTNQDVIDLRYAAQVGVPQSELAQHYGLIAVSRIVHRKTWKSVGDGEPSPSIEAWLRARSAK